MPKRPCSIVMTRDQSTILSADKFGDVYALPLHFTPADVASTMDTVEISAPAKPFIPAATSLTVHSQRNLQALEHQKRVTNHAPTKTEPTFQKTLLLGHVSMLTDIAVASDNGREYIITADRDEHIRISRGIPQTYVIENYCLGHQTFVTRLCIPKYHQDILISGDGDGYILVWKWTSDSSKTVAPAYRQDMREHLQGVVDIPEGPLSVSQIIDVTSSGSSDEQALILVTLERYVSPRI